MAKDPFYYQLDENFRGTRVRVQTSQHSYEGWARMWHYSQHAILLYDVTRDDGKELGPVTINEPKTVERIEPRGPIREIPVDAIRPSPYSVREHDDVDHQQFVRQTRDRGHLLTFPSVRPLANDECGTDASAGDTFSSGTSSSDAYETVGGHRRLEAARRAGLETIPVRVLDLDDWEAAERFVAEHIPLAGESDQELYSPEEVKQALAKLREEWADERLRELPALGPSLETVLASTRRERIRRGHSE